MTAEPLPQPKLLWGLLCDYFLIDVAGKQSYIGVFEQITAQSFPAQHKLMNVVSAIEGPAGVEARGLLTLWSPDDRIVLSTPEIAVQFNQFGRAVVVNMLYDVRFEQPGRYTAVMELNRRKLGSINLEVVGPAS